MKLFARSWRMAETTQLRGRLLQNGGEPLTRKPKDAERLQYAREYYFSARAFFNDLLRWIVSCFGDSL